MRLHPILNHKNNLLIYTAIWLVLIFTQTIALSQLFNFSWEYALADSLVYGILFYGFGIGIYFFIRFQDFGKSNNVSVFIEQATALIVILSIWVFSGLYILSSLFPQNAIIIQFLNESISWRYVNGFLMFLVLIFFYYLNSYYTHIQEKQKKENDLLRTLKDTEINLLRSKLNPHFLFNSLNSLYALIETEPDKASEMILELSDFLRFSLDQDYKKLIPLEEEITNIDRYLSIERMRFGDKIKLHKEWSDGCDNSTIPALILQPLLENAIKYGLQGDIKELEITLRCQFKDNDLYLEINNNFDDKAIPRKGAGMGIYSVRKRLEILYKQNHLFSIEQKNTNFMVRLIIPQKPKTHA